MRDVTIDDITEFVEKQARSLNNPIFGKTENRRPSYIQATPKQDSSHAHRASFAAQVTRPNRENPPSSATSSENQTTYSCAACEDDHHQITDCPKFKNMKLTERLDVVKKKHLCFGCLRRGHQLKTCYKRKPCTECNQKHSTFLHSNNTDDVKESCTAPAKGPITSRVQATQADESNSKPSLHLNATTLPESESKTLLPVVLLDSGSTSTFCTENLIQRLHVTGEKTKIKLATLGGSESVETNLVKNLKITDLDGNNAIYLPAVLTRARFPVTSKEIPTQEDINKFPPLRDHVHLPVLTHSNVELIIGVDVPKALKPLEAISTPEGIFATKVSLGWAVNNNK